MSPIYFQDFVGSPDKRRESWTRVFNKSAGWTGAKPNEGHDAVATLVTSGKASCIITQNVDNLHQDAGVPDDKVIEIHGNATYCKCLECGKRYETESLKPIWEAGDDILCDACRGLIKTATISFGQPMPEDKMLRATDEARACDLCLVLGSSLVVYPAAELPLIAKRFGAKLVIVNRDATDQDELADLVLNTEIGPTMTAAVGMLDG
ncbi:UNVERIFIED_CONTAM: hypothetical protein GTU68_002839 [Idotea baltica]|nr:hypothetical protein [Idotea baltica]